MSVTGSLTEYKSFIYAGGKLVAQYHTRNDSSPAQLRYFHTDHLGSIDTITSDTGQVIERMSYDPFGKRRYPNGQSDPSHSLTGITTDYGFTQHEHLDGVNLIHMNGRVYDPSLGRFLSADPTIQYPESIQSYNRYSYVQNNPLSYTDPSGFGFFSSLFRAIGNVFRAIRQNFRSILAIGITFIPGLQFLGPVGLGFLSGLISGGDLKSGIIGAFTAGAFNAVGTLIPKYGLAKILAHGLVGGVSSKLQGGNFESGFLSAGFTEAVSPAIEGINPDHKGPDVERTIAAAVAGGAGSVLGGGKFINGAVTGAFSRLFNDDAANHQTSDSDTGGSSFTDELEQFGEKIKSFISDRLAVTLDARAALGQGVDASVKVDKDIFDKGLIVSAGSMLGIGLSTRATIDALVYDGGAIRGAYFKGSICIGAGLGGCGSINVDPATKNFRVYVSGGFVGGFSAGFRPAYTSRIKLLK